MRVGESTRQWKKGQLQDLVLFQRGFDITQAQQALGPYPVISSSGVTSYHNEFKANGPGVVIGRKGTLGSVHFSESDYWPHDTTLWSKDLRGNNPRFVYYFLHTIDFKRFDVGNSNPTLNRNHIHDLSVLIPPLAVQERITDILSAYDDLIENNRRRMALLEEAARQLYREWFVCLRFPGHEHTRITNGVPEGWERVPLGDRVELNYGKALKAENWIVGPHPVFGSSGIVGFHEKPLTQGPGIIVGRKGNIGSVYWCTRDYWPIDTVYFVGATTSNLWLYYALQHLHFISTDVAVPGLNRDFAYSRLLLIPPDRILRGFLDVATSLYQQTDKLNEMNDRLRAARDLLLPRLMSGEIAV
jgi:type I restriction enzyme S subunit